MIGERDAIEITRRFLAERRHTPFDEASLTIAQDQMDGRAIFIVTTLDALPPDTEDWMAEPRIPLVHFVDAETGKVIGYETERGRTLFPPGFEPRNPRGTALS